MRCQLIPYLFMSVLWWGLFTDSSAPVEAFIEFAFCDLHLGGMWGEVGLEVCSGVG